MTIKIIVATHKEYSMPSDPIYLPLQVGKENTPPLPYEGDDTGDNISKKNSEYCELTGLYWAWKNIDADYIGLCHYRRYFVLHRFGKKKDRILSGSQAESILETTPVILPKKRNYYIETNYSQYIHAHHKADLDAVRNILESDYVDYLPAFDAHMAQTKGHLFNMLIMRKDILDAYCSWLFSVLQKLEQNLDTSQYSKNDKRVFGFIAERLIDPWINTNGIHYRELPVQNMEPVNWPLKVYQFLHRKLTYDKG